MEIAGTSSTERIHVIGLELNQYTALSDVALAAIASEVAWDAVLACVQEETLVR
jgi:hypothetical protein